MTLKCISVILLLKKKILKRWRMFIQNVLIAFKMVRFVALENTNRGGKSAALAIKGCGNDWLIIKSRLRQSGAIKGKNSRLWRGRVRRNCRLILTGPEQSPIIWGILIPIRRVALEIEISTAEIFEQLKAAFEQETLARFQSRLL
ncbi:hypothetical protein KKB83_04410 [Patescibacteria group bacterium]|nr:hypothetical protein [Patescibacteria group bacterium]